LDQTDFHNVLEHQVPVHDHAQRLAGAHGEGRLHVELALDQALAGAVVCPVDSRSARMMSLSPLGVMPYVVSAS
jgi:hypothetical protein